MKELLWDYYGIKIEDFRTYQDGVIFHVNGDNYYLCKTYLKHEEVYKSYELYLLLRNMNIILHDFVFNKNGELLSEDYVLLKLNYLIDDIGLNDLKKINVKINYDFYYDFYNLWIDKIDYFEKRLFISDNNLFVSYSFDYFVGVSEILLDLYKSNAYDLNNNYVVHRTFYSLSTIDYYNPLNIILGNRLKDYCFYIRLTNDWDLLSLLLKDLDIEEKVYLFVRLSFPFYYFHHLDYFLEKGESKNELLDIIENIEKYETYLGVLEDVINIKVFNWIKKDN